jgi:hypothetical protein
MARAHKPKHRRVFGLEWARAVEGWPRGIPRPRGLRGSKAGGLRFEREVAAALVAIGYIVNAGQWFEFHDANGPGLCQTDLLFDGMVVECKLSDAAAARAQLEELYLPVLRMVYRQQLHGLVVIRHQTPKLREAGIRPCGSLAFAMAETRRAGAAPAVLHYLGRGRL